MIRQLDDACWEISGDRDGWHHPDEDLARADAVACLAGRRDDGPVPFVTELPGRCWVADCDHPGCEAVFGDDGMVYFHAADQATLRSWGATREWAFTAAGRAFCGEHDRLPRTGDRSIGCRHHEQWCCDLCWPARSAQSEGLIP